MIRYVSLIMRYKIFAPRTYTLTILQIFTIYAFERPLIQFLQKTGYKCTPWIFPFIMSNIHFVLLFMLGVIYYYSDVPFMQYHNMYQLIRTGRRKWVIGQIISVICQSFMMIGFNILISIFFLGRHLDYSLEWGKVLHTASLTNLGEGYNFAFSIINSVMVAFTPIKTMLLAILVGGLVISIVGITMFTLSLIFNRLIAVTAVVVMVVMLFFVENTHALDAQKIAAYTPVHWFRIALINQKYHGGYFMPPLNYIITFLIGGIMVFSLLAVWKINNVEFRWNKED